LTGSLRFAPKTPADVATVAARAVRQHKASVDTGDHQELRRESAREGSPVARIVWSNVRLKRETHKRLVGFIESLRRAREQGKIDTPQRHNVDVTLDDAIGILLDREERKKERSVQSKVRAKQAKATAAAASETPEEAGKVAPNEPQDPSDATPQGDTSTEEWRSVWGKQSTSPDDE